LSIAAGIAESKGLTKLLIANHGGDHIIYPDCRPDFIHAMDYAVTKGTFTHLHIIAPYTNISKTDIVRRGLALGIDYAETWSCYKGGDTPCGTCSTCIERQQAFHEAEALPHLSFPLPDIS